MRSRAARYAPLAVALSVTIAVLFGLLPHREPNASQHGMTTPHIGHSVMQEGAGTGDSSHREQAKSRGPGIVELHFMGRLGNNLFEYAVARTIADDLGWALFLHTARGNAKKYGTLLRPVGMKCFPGVRSLGPDINSPEMRDLPVLDSPGLKRRVNNFGSKPSRIVLRSWYQNYELFAAYKDQLRQVR